MAVPVSACLELRDLELRDLELGFHLRPNASALLSECRKEFVLLLADECSDGVETATGHNASCGWHPHHTVVIDPR